MATSGPTPGASPEATASINGGGGAGGGQKDKGSIIEWESGVEGERGEFGGGRVL